MLRPDLRDLIRYKCGIEGDESLDVVINLFIQDEINRYTALNKYTQLFHEDTVGTWGETVNDTPGILLIAQHLDLENIYFLPDGDIDAKVRLWPWNKYRENVDGTPTQFRRVFKTGVGPNLRTEYIEVTPYTDIDTAIDTVQYNYWSYYTWDDTNEFIIQELLPSIMESTIARLAKSDQGKLYTMARTNERNAFIATRAAAR